MLIKIQEVVIEHNLAFPDDKIKLDLGVKLKEIL